MSEGTNEASITIGEPGITWLTNVWTASIAEHFEI